jgi:hypothetical protein
MPLVNCKLCYNLSGCRRVNYVAPCATNILKETSNPQTNLEHAPHAASVYDDHQGSVACFG